MALLRKGSHSARRSGYAYAAARATWFLGLIAFGHGRARRRPGATTKTRSRRSSEWATPSRPPPRTTCWPRCMATSATNERSGTIASRRWRCCRSSRSQRLRYIVLATTAAAVRRQDPETSSAVPGCGASTMRGQWDARRPSSSRSARAAAVLAELGRDADAAARPRGRARDRSRPSPTAALRQRIEEPMSGRRKRCLPTVTIPPRAVAAAELAHRPGQRARRSAAHCPAVAAAGQGQHRVGQTWPQPSAALNRGIAGVR